MSIFGHNGLSISRLNDRLSVTLQGDIVQETLMILSTDLLERVQTDRVNLVIFDLSSVDILDVTEFNALHRIALMIKLMGAESIFIGLNPGMVIFLVSAGADVSGINTAYGHEDIERALRLLNND